MKPTLILDRPPRIQPELPFATIEIPAPPKKELAGIERVVHLALPLVTIIGYVLVAALAGRGRSPWLMIPMALSVVASTAFALYSYRQEKQRQAEIEKAYDDRLVELNQEMQEYHEQQRRFYYYNYPDRAQLFGIVRETKDALRASQRGLRSATRVYERRVEDADFGALRLGIGTLPSTVRYVLKEAENFEDRQVRAAMKLQEDSLFVSNIPVILNLRDPDPDAEPEEKQTIGNTPISHAVGIAGEKDEVYEYVRFLLAQYAVFHAPMDAKLYVLGAHSAPWAWLANLPHCQDDEHHRRRYFAEEEQLGSGTDALTEPEGTGLEQFLEGLRSTLAQRKIRLEDQGEAEQGADPRHPFLLLVVDLLDVVYDSASPLKDLEEDAAISILLEEGARLGAAVLFLTPERSKIPSRCRSVIEVERTTPATNSRILSRERLHFRYAETGVNSYRFVGQADRIAEPRHCEALANELSHLEVREGYGANLVSTLSFLDLMQRSTLAEVLDSAAVWWTENMQPARADWLRTKFARMSGNKDRTLVFSASRDGVHGMVAGSTGSGKSELLITLITGMALRYDPRMLNFVLVDYKGGGAFAGLYSNEARLPHCVDLITNLRGAAVNRMFTAINAELQRRQQLLVDAGARDIVAYYRRGLHQRYPLPFLFIIIDEFAEMIADRSDYRSQLESITRIGRSLGVSLILAAQNPSGVTDQMRSNMKFRICLRVETPAQSRELLRRGDAAFLPSIPGRGYLQVGNDEIELIQVAYAGEKYVEPQGEEAAQPVLWPDRRPASVPIHEPTELYKLIAQRLQEQAKLRGIPRQRAPWPDFLPARLALNQPLSTGGEAHAPGPAMEKAAAANLDFLQQQDVITLGRPALANLTLNPAFTNWINEPDSAGWEEDIDWPTYTMRPVIGLVDDPQGARQIPLHLNLRQGHAVLYGASGWGKSTFLRTLVLSLAATHSPNRLHIYLLDLGGRSLMPLEELPHVGSVISLDEEGYEERVAQLLRLLEEAVGARKELVNEAGVADIYEFNALHPRQMQPAILVGIDNFHAFQDAFGKEADDEYSPVVRLVNLARQSRPYGVHFVATAGQASSFSAQIASLFTQRLTLKQNDPAEYRTIVGGSVEEIESLPGRGYVQIDRMPMAFQIALPFDLAEGGAASEAERIRTLGRQMTEYAAAAGDFRLPRPIHALPGSVLLRHLLAQEFAAAQQEEAFLAALPDLVQERWAASTQADQADWLEAPLGVVSGDQVRTLRLEAKADGVHGLIAGGTGAGKSELLISLVVGLALRYDPTVLNFVLVDYKGGGAFQPFADLPHCVDLVTNLNPSAVERMFTAIRAEMQRRQRLNQETDTKDIVEYRRRNLHHTHAPYPHLFIIIDEYAEMITDAPAFREELESITRVGRSLGVHLLLASQRPIGVTDQMRANIKYRICLRVEQMETSRELLRRPDAALLPSGLPGRGYLQVGSERLELLQVAYTGEELAAGEELAEGKAQKFYEYAVDLCSRLWDRRHPKRLDAPWPPFLSERLTFSTPIASQYVPDPADRRFMESNDAGEMLLNDRVRRWTVEETEEPVSQWAPVDWRQDAMRAVVGLLDDPARGRVRPLLVDFQQGHAIVFGGPGWGKTTFLRSLIMSLAATHAPQDLHVHLLDMGGRNLEALEALPHVGTVILPDERGYEERIQQLLREMHDLINQRRRLFSAAGVADFYEFNQRAAQQPDRPIQPAQLLVLDNFGEFVETFGVRAEQDDPDSIFASFIALARQGRTYGVHLMVTASQVRSVPSKLYSLFTERYTLRLADPNEYGAVVGGGVNEIDPIPGRGYVRVERRPLSFQVALHPGNLSPAGAYVGGDRRLLAQMGAHMERSLQALQWTGPRPLKIDALPPLSLYRTLLGEAMQVPLDERWWDRLKEAVEERWRITGEAENADWLRAPIGVISGNRPRTLYFAATKDGVHGLVAGGTGSGKSELLMSLIVGLALNYAPEVLNFVLVDFKGGGAFQPFEQLPHCVSVVTNLNESAVERMFTAINAELRRRQALNQQTNTRDIVEYRRRGLHRTHAPYPHLFVIIDEYAEMIDNYPDYRGELESITRVGRAQGVHLILASQKPKGVTDQMRANIKLRICLRVEEPETSRELLRQPDAAQLPGIPGRGYLQVGNDSLELVQVAWSGENVSRPLASAVVWPDRRTASAEAPEETAEASGEVVEAPFFEHAVHLAAHLWRDRLVAKPWPDALPRFLSLQSPWTHPTSGETQVLEPRLTHWLNGEDDPALWSGVDWAQEAFCAPVGLVDDPREARQFPLRVELRRSHLILLGDAGYGKTSFLRTLLTALAVSHGPHELHAYIVDMGGRNYGSVQGLPHVGAVIYGDENTFEERFRRLLKYLNAVQRERQQRLGEESIFAYNQRHPEEPLPRLLVMIDNFAELQQNYESLVESDLLPLLRSSLAVGIAFVATANQPSDMSGKLYRLFGQRVTFHQRDRDRYQDIVGRGAKELEELPGRGYIRWEGRPLQFQAAAPTGLPEDGDLLPRGEGQDLRLLAEIMGDRAARLSLSPDQRPKPIEALAAYISLEDLLAAAPPPGHRQLRIPLGIDEDLQPALMDMERGGQHFPILGRSLSGRTTTLYSWVFAVAERYDPTQAALVLVDMRRSFVNYGGQRTLADLPHTLACVTEVEALAPVVEYLQAEGKALREGQSTRRIFVVIDNFDDLHEELRQQNVYATLAEVARRYGQDGIHFVAALSAIDATSPLRRPLAAANYGIVLRSLELLQSNNVLGVTRHPRNAPAELVVGRGFLVRAGSFRYIQIASPYPDMDPEDASDAALARKAECLDAWVERIRRRHPTLQAAWSTPVETEETGRASGLQPSSPDHEKALALVKRIMQLEPERSKELLRELFWKWMRAAKIAEGLSEEFVDNAYRKHKLEDLLREVNSLIDGSNAK